MKLNNDTKLINADDGDECLVRLVLTPSIKNTHDKPVGMA